MFILTTVHFSVTYPPGTSGNKAHKKKKKKDKDRDISPENETKTVTNQGLHIKLDILKHNFRVVNKDLILT